MSDGAMYRDTSVYLSERGEAPKVEGGATNRGMVSVYVEDPAHRGNVHLQMTPAIARDVHRALGEALTDLDGRKPEEAA